MFCLLLILYCIGFISIMVVHYKDMGRKYYVICKTCTSSIFVLSAWMHMQGHFNGLWFLAFCLCLMGDIFLGIDEGNRKQSKNFIFGVISFALAHLFFIPVMWKVVPFHWMDLIIPIMMSVMIFFLTKTRFMDTKGNDIACIIYALIVSSLMVKGIQLYWQNPAYILVMIGTICFFISDFILFFQYFFIKKIKCLKFFNLLTYYAATMLLAISAIV